MKADGDASPLSPASRKLKEELEELIAKLFDAYDIDGDRAIEFDELTKLETRLDVHGEDMREWGRAAMSFQATMKGGEAVNFEAFRRSSCS